MDSRYQRFGTLFSWDGKLEMEGGERLYRLFELVEDEKERNNPIKVADLVMLLEKFR